MKLIFNFKFIILNQISNFKFQISNSLFKEKGFTLVEILVSATIIGLLSTIGMTGFQAITRSGRDALRKSDLEQLRSALEIYKSENSSYPIASNCIAALPTQYIKYPADPKPSQYRYCFVQVSALSYQLCAHLENGSSVASSSFCNDSGGNLCTANCNYQVTNP